MSVIFIFQVILFGVNEWEILLENFGNSAVLGEFGLSFYLIALLKVVFLEFIEKLKLIDGFLVMPRKWDFLGVDREMGINESSAKFYGKNI